MRPSFRKTRRVASAFALFSLCAAASSGVAAEKTFEFASGPGKARLLELYTSQSRSTCPPAEAWMTGLRGHSELWSGIVPVAFHVSQWDKRGWKDRLARPEFTSRYVGWLSRWRSSTPYVPTVVLDGVEWSGWAREKDIPPASPLPAGALSVKKISDNEYRALYVPEEGARGPWYVNGALLGFGVSTRIEAGENIGRTLRQDFVALKYDRRAMETTRDGFRATLRLPSKGEARTLAKEGLGLAVWVSRGDALLPVQAAGTFLPGYREKK